MTVVDIVIVMEVPLQYHIQLNIHLGRSRRDLYFDAQVKPQLSKAGPR